jgi:hypothetical protein
MVTFLNLIVLHIRSYNGCFNDLGYLLAIKSTQKLLDSKTEPILAIYTQALTFNDDTKIIHARNKPYTRIPAIALAVDKNGVTPRIVDVEISIAATTKMRNEGNTPKVHKRGIETHTVNNAV